MSHILLLGGTAEARVIRAACALPLTYSLAGRLNARPEPGQRVGGFGGAEGLADWARAHDVTCILDATHPYAAQIKLHAAAAAAQCVLPCAHLIRPPWPAEGCVMARNMAQAASLIPSKARVFLAVGRMGAQAFEHRPDADFIARFMPGAGAAPNWLETVEGAPSEDIDAEQAMLARARATHLVMRNSGGDKGRAKLIAGQRLGLEIIMIMRPAPPPRGVIIETVEEALGFIAAHRRNCCPPHQGAS